MPESCAEDHAVGMRKNAPDGLLAVALQHWLAARSVEPLVVLDSRRRVVLANEPACALFGAEVELVVASDELGIGGFLATVECTGHAATELVLPLHDGLRTVTLRGDRVDGFVILQATDTTAERALEQEARRLRRLEAANETTVSLVHDFKNLLTVVLSIAATLERVLPGDDISNACIRMLLDTVEHGSAMVTKVLRTIRGERVEPEVSDLGKVLVELLPLVEGVVGKSIRVELEVASDLGDASVDREQLARVLLNLAANARDAMPRGGRLCVSATNVDLDQTGTEDYVALVVTDDGIGMPEEVRERVLDGFVTTKGNGTGLGLVGAHRFATAAGGFLSIRSTPEEGTIVAIYLPRRRPRTSFVDGGGEEDETRETRRPTSISAMHRIDVSSCDEDTPCASGDCN